jgi:hypothetical protein
VFSLFISPAPPFLGTRLLQRGTSRRRFHSTVVYFLSHRSAFALNNSTCTLPSSRYRTPPQSPSLHAFTPRAISNARTSAARGLGGMFSSLACLPSPLLHLLIHMRLLLLLLVAFSGTGWRNVKRATFWLRAATCDGLSGGRRCTGLAVRAAPSNAFGRGTSTVRVAVLRPNVRADVRFGAYINETWCASICGTLTSLGSSACARRSSVSYSGEDASSGIAATTKPPSTGAPAHYHA